MIYQLPTDFRLSAGAHPSPEQGMCVMEAVAFIAGESFSDRPTCASPVIAEFLRSWNDLMNDEDRQQLKPFIPRLIGTKADEATELKRSYMALDWHCRVSAPTWLRVAKLTAEAEAIETCAPIVDKASCDAATQALKDGSKAVDAARPAARAAARDAAGAAARDAAGAAAEAAAWAAAGAAAWAAARAAARAAAGAAAWAAAWDAAGAAARAAAWDAAGAAAWAAARAAARDAARAALRPTVVQLQASALELIDRMIAVGASDDARCLHHWKRTEAGDYRCIHCGQLGDMTVPDWPSK